MMKFVQIIIAVVILLFGISGTDGNTIDTPTLNPYLHYINITIVYHDHDGYISQLYGPIEEVFLGYGVVLASCFLNISNEVNSTTDTTSDTVSVRVQNVNISLFIDSYRVTITEHENGDQDIMVRFEFYLSQDDTLILATTAIEVFNRNCNINDWSDDFTSDTITAEAVFSSMQLMQSISSSQTVLTTFSQNTLITIFPTSSTQSIEPTTTSMSTSQSPETSSIEFSSATIPITTSVPSSMLQLSTSFPSTDEIISSDNLLTNTASISSSITSVRIIPSTTITMDTTSTTDFTSIPTDSITSSYSMLTSNTLSSSSATVSARMIPSTTVLPTDTILITHSTHVLTDSITNFGSMIINYVSSSSIPPVRILQSQSIFVSSMVTTSFVSTGITQSSRLPTNYITTSRNFTASNTTGISSSLPIRTLPQSSTFRITDTGSIASTSIPQSSRIPAYIMSSSSNLSTSNTIIPSQSSVRESISSVPTIQSQSNTFRTTDSINILSTAVTRSILSPVNSTRFITPASVSSTRSLDMNLTQTNSTQLLLNSTIIPPNISMPTSSSIVLPVISYTQDSSQIVIPSRTVSQEPSSLFSTFNITSIQSTTTQVFLSTTTPPIIDTPALNPYLHYINITIVYHDDFISELFRPSEEVFPGYGVVLASCFLNISNEVNSTTDNTSDTVSVRVQNVNISLFIDSYRVTQTIDENDEGNTTVIFEFYLSQDDTLLPATTAIEVFNRNCNIHDWSDDFTSDTITAVAVFSSMQSQIIPTSSSIGVPILNSSQISSRSIPQQPSSTLLNTSSITIIPSTTQPFPSTILPMTSTTTISPPIAIQPTLHYLEAIFTFGTFSDVEIYQIPNILQSIANRYLNTTVSILPSESTLLLSITIGDVTFNALTGQLHQSQQVGNIVTARILFYVTSNTTPLLSTILKTQLDMYSIDQWTDSTELQVINVEFNLYRFVSSSSIPTTSQISPTLSIMSTIVITSSTVIPQSIPAVTTLSFQSSVIPSRSSTSQTNRTESVVASNISVASRVQVMASSLSQASIIPVSSILLQSTSIQPMTSRNLTQSVSVNDTVRTSQVYNTSNIPTRSSVIPVFNVSSSLPQLLNTTRLMTSVFNTSVIPTNSSLPILSTRSSLVPILNTSSVIPIISTRSSVIPVFSTSSIVPILSTRSSGVPIFSTSSVIPIISTRSSVIPVFSTSSIVPILSTRSSGVPIFNTSSVIPIISTRSSVIPVFSTSSVIPIISTRSSGVPIFSTSSVTPIISTRSSGVPILNTSSVTPIISTRSSVIPVFSTSSIVPILSSRSSIVPIFTNRSSIIPIFSTSSVMPIISSISSVVPIFNSSSSVLKSSITVLSHSSLLPSISSSMSTVSTHTPPPGYVILPDYNPGIGYLLVLNLLTNQSQGVVNLSQSFYRNTELQLIDLFSLALEKEPSVNNRRRRNVFNTTTRIACDIVQGLTTAEPTNLRLIFYISRELNNNPLIILTANTSLTIYLQLEDSDYKDILGYEFVSISIYQGPAPPFATLALLTGCILGCCILILLVFLITLSLYHCLHSNYIRVDRWSPEKSLEVSLSNQGVYTSSSTKLLFEEGVSVTDRFSEGTQTLARHFLDETDQFAVDRADYAFTLRTEPNLFSPVQTEETHPLEREDLDQLDPPQFSQSLAGLRSVIEEERRLTNLAEASLLEVMSSNRTQMDSMLEENTRRERASAVYERSKKEMGVSTGAVTLSNSLRSSEDSSRSQSRPKSGRGSKVAPSTEAPNLSFSSKSTPPARILDWVPVSPESLSKPTQLTGFRSVRQPNIMQVVPRQGIRSLSPLPSYAPTPDPPTEPLKSIPVRIIGTDGESAQMRSSNTDGVATTKTINVLPSFNPFYSTAKKDYPPL